MKKIRALNFLSLLRSKIIFFETSEFPKGHKFLYYYFWPAVFHMTAHEKYFISS